MLPTGLIIALSIFVLFTVACLIGGAVHVKKDKTLYPFLVLGLIVSSWITLFWSLNQVKYNAYMNMYKGDPEYEMVIKEKTIKTSVYNSDGEVIDVVEHVISDTTLSYIK